MSSSKKRQEKPFSFSLLTDVHWASQDTNEYLAFAAEIEGRLEEAGAGLEGRIRKRLEEVPKEHRDDFIESEAWTSHLYQNLFPNLHRESMFVTLYSYLEHRLNVICQKIGEETGSKLKLKDLHGTGFERALLFLKRIPEFDFNAISHEIAFIRNANSVRNIVVHVGGTLPEDKGHKANRFVESEGTLSGNPGAPISISGVNPKWRETGTKIEAGWTDGNTPSCNTEVH